MVVLPRSPHLVVTPWCRSGGAVRVVTCALYTSSNCCRRKTLPQCAKLSSSSRHRSRLQGDEPYAAVVAGSGPAGLAAVGNLLEQNIGKILWVDPAHDAGKINKDWREVPSNTKVGLFLNYAKALEPFRQVIEETREPNAITALENLEQDKGCQISYAADMVRMLAGGLREHSQVQPHVGNVDQARWDSQDAKWTVGIRDNETRNREFAISSRIVLCNGATSIPTPVALPGMKELDLETAMKPSVLAKVLQSDDSPVVAVIGGSHSAILILLNLFELAKSSHPNLRVKWFTRSPLRYAIYKDGWILYDNTGLKGLAADFAKENLEDSTLPNSPAGKFIEKIDTSENEEHAYAKHLSQCTHIVPGIGFVPNALPNITLDGKRAGNVQYDHRGGGFTSDKGELRGMFGAGIAYPERVTDPYGNVEMNVGFWKFMYYLQRVTKEWAKPP